MAIDARCRIVSLFCYILCLHLLAIFFFTRGFLLTRTELSEFSTCSDIAKSPCFGENPVAVSSENVDLKHDNDLTWQPVEENLLNDNDRGSEDNLNGECWTKPAIKRVIIIIIDALRFDFVAPSSNFAGEYQPWMDKLQVLQQLTKERNGSARIFKFVADPPTTTLQRLKGLMTGGLPTFVDVGHSFGAPAIMEDNLIHQLVQAGKRVRMMGDDTWMKLFPSQFSVAHPFDSFNVKDLHTVDDGVIREIFPALIESDWNVLIAHFLGVDHVGHIFGVESPFMVKKLEQYNRVLQEIVAVLKSRSGPGDLHEDTMLLVLGDHGQTLYGDHGGGTSEEVESALFALSMREPSGRLPLDLQSSTCTMKMAQEDETDPSHCITTFPQLDFAATMAALLGVPFPFGSVGRVNTELYALAASTWLLRSKDEGHLPEDVFRVWLERYNDVLCMNSWQVKRYLDAYTASSIRGFPTEDLAHVQSLYEKTHTILHSLHTDYSYMQNNSSKSNFSEFEEYTDVTVTRLTDGIKRKLVYLLAAANLARTQWTQFEDEWMAIGLILLITSLVIYAVVLTRALRFSHRAYLSEVMSSMMQSNFHELFPFKRMLMACGGVSVIAGVVWGFQMMEKRIRSSSATATSYGQTNTIIAAGVLIASVVAYVIPFYGSGQSNQSIFAKGHTVGTGCQYQGACIPSARSCMAVLFVGLHACGLLSNSYIIGEGQVVCFLLATSGILYLRQASQSGCKVPQAILFLMLNGGMASVGLVEGFKDPTTIGRPSHNADYFLASDSPQLFTLLWIAFATTILPLSSLAWLILRRARAVFTSKSLYGVTAMSVTLAYFLLVIHWFTMDLVSSLTLEVPQPFKEFSRLLCPQIVYSVSLMHMLFTISIMMLNSRTSASTPYKDLLVEGIVSILSGLSGTIILLLGRKGPMIVLLAVLEVWCIVDLQSLEFLNQKTTEAGKEFIQQDMNSNERSLSSHFAAAVDWNLVAVQLFFCTGHRCTFDGLHYPAAFIGFDDFHFYRQGALLAADTFGSSHILPVIGLPLLVTAAAMGTPSESKYSSAEDNFLLLEVTKVYISYGLVRTILTTVTAVCVTLQRRHLMVWGLFAPKYVFDALGLLIIDGSIVIALIFYFSFFSRRKVKTD